MFSAPQSSRPFFLPDQVPGMTKDANPPASPDAANPPMLGSLSEGKKTPKKPSQTVLGTAALSDTANTSQKSLLGQ